MMYFWSDARLHRKKGHTVGSVSFSGSEHPE